MKLIIDKYEAKDHDYANRLPSTPTGELKNIDVQRGIWLNGILQEERQRRLDNFNALVQKQKEEAEAKKEKERFCFSHVKRKGT